MLPAVLAGENIVSVPGPSWATTFVQVLVISAGVAIGLVILLRALRRRGRARVAGVLVAAGVGVALPLAAWIGLSGRFDGGDVGEWHVSCEEPFVTSQRDPTQPGQTVGWDDFVARCSQRGAAKSTSAEALVSLAVLLVAGGVALGRTAVPPRPDAHHMSTA